jgi:hypothetical protein
MVALTKKKVEKKYKVDELKFFAVPIKDSELRVGLYAYLFPKLVFRIIDSFMEDGRRKNYEHYLCLQELNAFLAEMYSDIVHVNPVKYSELHFPWILAKEKLPKEDILQFIKQWVNIYYPKNHIDLSLLDLEEEKLDIKFLFGLNPNGTAKMDCEPNVGRNTHLIFIRYLLHELNQMSFSIKGKDKNLYGNFTKLLDKEGDDKLISWKPHGEIGKWSYSVELSLQSIPFDRSMYLFIHPKLFRCANSTFLRNPKTGVNLLYQLPEDYVIGEGGPSLVTFELKIGSKYAKWPRFSEVMLKMMGSEKLLPPIDDFKKNPAHYLDQNNFLSIAIPYGSHFKNIHSVKSGLGNQERLQLAEQIMSQLRNIWSGFGDCFPQLPKLAFNSSSGKSKFQNHVLPDVVQLVYTDLKWKDELIKVLIKEFNLNQTGQEEVFQLDQKCIRITCVSAFEMFGDNPYDINVEDKKVNEARKKYADRIRKAVEESNAISFAFIELPNKESFEEGTDPKDILRNSFAKKGILTQFIVPIEPKDTDNKSNKENKVVSIEHRCLSAVRDMRRQFGDLKSIYKKFPVKTGLVGIHVSKHAGKFIPLLVSLLGEEIYANAPTIRENWVPYRLLPQILAKNVAKTITADKDKVSFLLYKALEQFRSLYDVDHTILFAVAQNIRSVVPWFQNTKISENEIILGKDRYLSTEKYSIIRVRQEDRNETPEWTGRGIYLKEEEPQIKDVPEALQTGLVRWNENVFFSIARKPNTFRVSPGTKLENESTAFRRETAVELTILTYNKKYSDPFGLAKLTHGLRNISIQTDDYLENPLPIHLAKLLEEYIFVK